MLACGASGAGRYQPISGPPAVSCPSTIGNGLPQDGCGVMILDSQTGALFVHRTTDWLEENPRTGEVTLHDLKIK
jgi:hypothetical protein